ncbi:hypothetical protein [Streptomyces sp. NPDC003635]
MPSVKRAGIRAALAEEKDVLLAIDELATAGWSACPAIVAAFSMAAALPR